MGGQEALVHHPLPVDDVKQGECQGGVAPGERLEVQVGRLGRRVPDRVDDDDRAAELLEPVPVGMRSRGGRVRPPDEHAIRVPDRPGVEAVEGRSQGHLEGDVPGLVADRVGIDLGRPEPVEEPQREPVRQQRAGPGVMGVHDGPAARSGEHVLDPSGDQAEGLVPPGGAELSRSLRPGPHERTGEPGGRVPPDPVVGQGALAAEGSAVHRVSGVAADPDDLPVSPCHQDAASVVAVPRASGADHVLIGSARHMSPRIAA